MFFLSSRKEYAIIKQFITVRLREEQKEKRKTVKKEKNLIKISERVLYIVQQRINKIINRRKSVKIEIYWEEETSKREGIFCVSFLMREKKCGKKNVNKFYVAFSSSYDGVDVNKEVRKQCKFFKRNIYANV